MHSHPPHSTRFPYTTLFRSTYTGAPAEVIESQITEPLEENINAVAGVRTLTSQSREGRSTITVEFELGSDLETAANRSEEHTSELQSPCNLVCRLLLENKNE